MSLFVTHGTPIPTRLAISGTLERTLPPPQIQIPRQVQGRAAWCYAASASMVISKVHPGMLVRQCDVAHFVKNADCCHAGAPPGCTNRGCSKSQLRSILSHWNVASQPQNSAVPPNVVSQEIAAQRPIEVIIDWFSVPGKSSSHAVLLIGFSGGWVFVRDPLTGDSHDGWQTYVAVRRGFGHGNWSMSLIGLS